MEASAITQLFLPLALFIIMLGVGMTLSGRDFGLLLRAPRAVLTGLVSQLCLLPVLAFIGVQLLELSAVMSVGLMILAFAPGGVTSNMLSLLAKGDTALSVTLTGITSLVTPFTLPLMSVLALNYWSLSDAQINLPVLPAIAKMVLITLVPIVLGMLVHHFYPQIADRARKGVKLLSLLFMLVVVVSIVLANSQHLGAVLASAGPAVLLVSVGALLVGYLAGTFAGLSGRQRITIGLETGVQNAGTALMVTSGLLDNPEMSAIVLMYGVLMQVPALGIVLWRNPEWLGLAPRMTTQDS
ncbi:bile acid:sodium symporter family protein [Marinobacterium sp. AK62]|uniref:Bile acid:sodium symporter family protein n=1 Tax=Marinobacterium alkalitolerans TaxID=1542925 RepID=A0ABS3ZB88_9GAMM|nr:bile acid:sodium symporter family protein [Marinobacterium alkalitolerans]MBP0048965.1 bile acid:sodium symporter family protein [Marinobacterium alkalitolerans]